MRIFEINGNIFFEDCKAVYLQPAPLRNGQLLSFIYQRSSLVALSDGICQCFLTISDACFADNIGIDVTSALDDSFQIPCEICDALVSAHELELHQVSKLLYYLSSSFTIYNRCKAFIIPAYILFTLRKF